MTTIEPIDQHLSNYIVAKQLNPKARIVWRQYRRKDVEDADYLTELLHGGGNSVKTLKDWDTVKALAEFFAKRWPSEFNEFKASIPDIRHSRRAGGKSRSGEITYKGAVPPRLMRLIRVAFPLQQWDKQFTDKLIRKMPLMKVAGENNWG